MNEDSNVVPGISADHIFAITELAKIGFEFLKEGIKNRDKDMPEAMYNHYKSLVEVAGESAVTHFSNICQYLYENQEQQKNGSEVDGQAMK